ncbi:hypothetical protein GCM10023085_63040 [Actinomadura viridis]
MARGLTGPPPPGAETGAVDGAARTAHRSGATCGPQGALSHAGAAGGPARTARRKPPVTRVSLGRESAPWRGGRMVPHPGGDAVSGASKNVRVGPGRLARTASPPRRCLRPRGNVWVA